jgi:hypothetical protein
MRYCSLTCYRDVSHRRCVKGFDEHELFDSMNIDDEPAKHQSMTTSNPFVRDRIDDIIKRKLDEKDLHDENDDEHIDEFFEQTRRSNDAEHEHEVVHV